MVLSEALSNKQKRPTNIYRNKFKVNPAKSALTKIFDHIKNNKRPIPVKNKPLQNSKRKQFIIPRPRPAGFFDNNLARAFLIPAIPTLIGNETMSMYRICNFFLSEGLGAGLAWVVAQSSGISASISSIGSPTTNVTVSMTNNNSPDITQSVLVTNTAINTNNDQDTINQSNTVTVTNTNGKRRRRKRRRVIIEEPKHYDVTIDVVQPMWSLKL